MQKLLHAVTLPQVVGFRLPWSPTLHGTEAAWRALYQTIPSSFGQQRFCRRYRQLLSQGAGMTTGCCTLGLSRFSGTSVQEELRFVLHHQQLFTREPRSGFSRIMCRSQAATYHCAWLFGRCLACSSRGIFLAFQSQCQNNRGFKLPKPFAIEARGQPCFYQRCISAVLLAGNGLQARRYSEGSELTKPSVDIFVLRM